MFNLDNITKKDDNKDWVYRKLIIAPSGSGKTNYLLNAIQKDNNIIDKIYLYAKNLEDPKYQILINKREQAGIKNLNDPNAFIENILIVWMTFIQTLKIITKGEKETF